jgi:hypothetical protein
MSQSVPADWFLATARTNARVAWVLTGFLVLTAGLHVFFGSVLVAATAAVASIVAVVPPAVHRDWRRTVPWPMLLLTTLALFVGLGSSFLGDFVFSLAIAALAVLVVVALQLTTTVRMTPNFVVGFVVIATLGTAGLWTLGAAASARYLGTPFVEDNAQLMIVFTATLAASVVSAVAFRWYAYRQLGATRRRDETEADVDAAATQLHDVDGATTARDGVDGATTARDDDDSEPTEVTQ